MSGSCDREVRDAPRRGCASMRLLQTAASVLENGGRFSRAGDVTGRLWKSQCGRNDGTAERRDSLDGDAFHVQQSSKGIHGSGVLSAVPPFRPVLTRVGAPTNFPGSL